MKASTAAVAVEQQQQQHQQQQEEEGWTGWQFRRGDLQQTPSVQSGWTVEREELDRAKACSLIYSAARKLQLPQLTAASACVYLHRFFMRHSLKEYHHYNIAATCLFVACKSEETLRKLESFIPVIVYYASKGKRKAPEGTSEFEKWRTVILHTEVVLLEALCFDMVVEHPYVALIGILETVRAQRQVGQMAWSFVADFLRLPLCLVWPARTLALAAVGLAARVGARETGRSVEDEGRWRARVGGSDEGVDEAMQWLLDFYSREAMARGGVHAAEGGGGSGGGSEAAQTPASSPGSTTSPMLTAHTGHQHASPLSTAPTGHQHQHQHASPSSSLGALK
ncbi:hypothetical protein LPJ53_000403 [Coemansia erecta]|uniref:Cyclin-like domain-containing protein n=1 Tax=Coemansia erecta TaxID=147472 RepID=A0A9W8CVQ9_9FUNG|nr:hypothetical protein LPJ53_000403 [Coemansia erecta]